MPRAHFVYPGYHLRFFVLAELRNQAALALAFDFDFPRPKASRASQGDGAAEAPLSERSEFGGRAPSAEKHRAPIRQRRIGWHQAMGFGFLLASKGTRARSARNVFCMILPANGSSIPRVRFAYPATSLR